MQRSLVSLWSGWEVVSEEGDIWFGPGIGEGAWVVMESLQGTVCNGRVVGSVGYSYEEL